MPTLKLFSFCCSGNLQSERRMRRCVECSRDRSLIGFLIAEIGRCCFLFELNWSPQRSVLKANALNYGACTSVTRSRAAQFEFVYCVLLYTKLFLCSFYKFDYFITSNSCVRSAAKEKDAQPNRINNNRIEFKSYRTFHIVFAFAMALFCLPNLENTLKTVDAWTNRGSQCIVSVFNAHTRKCFKSEPNWPLREL